MAAKSGRGTKTPNRTGNQHDGASATVRRAPAQSLDRSQKASAVAACVGAVGAARPAAAPAIVPMWYKWSGKQASWRWGHWDVAARHV